MRERSVKCGLMILVRCDVGEFFIFDGSEICIVSEIDHVGRPTLPVVDIDLSQVSEAHAPQGHTYVSEQARNHKVFELTSLAAHRWLRENQVGVHEIDTISTYAINHIQQVLPHRHTKTGRRLFELLCVVDLTNFQRYVADTFPHTTPVTQYREFHHRWKLTGAILACSFANWTYGVGLLDNVVDLPPAEWLVSAGSVMLRDNQDYSAGLGAVIGASDNQQVIRWPDQVGGLLLDGGAQLGLVESTFSPVRTPARGLARAIYPRESRRLALLTGVHRSQLTWWDDWIQAAPTAQF